MSQRGSEAGIDSKAMDPSNFLFADEKWFTTNTEARRQSGGQDPSCGQGDAKLQETSREVRQEGGGADQVVVALAYTKKT
jgi:hypothetical protein